MTQREKDIYYYALGCGFLLGVIICTGIVSLKEIDGYMPLILIIVCAELVIWMHVFSRYFQKTWGTEKDISKVGEVKKIEEVKTNEENSAERKENN